MRFCLAIVIAFLVFSFVFKVEAFPNESYAVSTITGVFVGFPKKTTSSFHHKMEISQSKELFGIKRFALEDFAFAYGMYFLAVGLLSLTAIIGSSASLGLRKGMFGWGVFGIVSGSLCTLVSIFMSAIFPMFGLPMLALSLAALGLGIAGIIYDRKKRGYAFETRDDSLSDYVSISPFLLSFSFR